LKIILQVFIILSILIGCTKSKPSSIFEGDEPTKDNYLEVVSLEDTDSLPTYLELTRMTVNSNLRILKGDYKQYFIRYNFTYLYNLKKEYEINSLSVYTYTSMNAFGFEELVDTHNADVTYISSNSVNLGEGSYNGSPIRLELSIVEKPYIDQKLIVSYSVYGKEYSNVELGTTSTKIDELNIMYDIMQEGEFIEFPYHQREYEVYESAYHFIDNYDSYKSATIKPDIYEITKIFKDDGKVYYNLSNIGWIKVSGENDYGFVIKPNFVSNIQESYKISQVKIDVLRDSEKKKIYENYEEDGTVGYTVHNEYNYFTELVNCKAAIYNSDEYMIFNKSDLKKIVEFECPSEQHGSSFTFDMTGFEKEYLNIDYLVSYEYDTVFAREVSVNRDSRHIMRGIN